MSYILEALKKADQERSIGEVPDLEAPHWGVRRRERQYRWAGAIALLLVLNGVLLAFLLGRDATDEVPTSGISGNAAGPEITRARETVGAAPQTPAPARRKVPPEARPHMPPPVPLAGQSSPQPAAGRSSPGGRQPPAGRSHAATSRVPDWDEMSLEFRSTFTPPHLDVHVYADEPGRRFILVDLKKYREGDTLQSGAVLEKILPDGILLNYQGTRFRLVK